MSDPNRIPKCCLHKPTNQAYVRLGAEFVYLGVYNPPQPSRVQPDHCRDGKPLGENEGPLRLVVPEENQQARSVRQVRAISVHGVN